MTIYGCTAIMGKGKTLIAVLLALDYAKKHPYANIYANFHIKGLKNFEYSPLMFLPLNSINEAFIIVDDIYALPTMKGFLSVMVNMSRKKGIDMLATAQYYTFIDPSIRTLSEKIEVELYQNMHLLVKLSNENDTFNKPRYFIYQNAIENAKNHYDTKEVVEMFTDSVIERELLRFSKSEKDLEMNISLLSKSEAKRKKMFKELKELL